MVYLSGVRMMNTENWLIAKVISGGQTGADRAALDWACENEVPHGGWCPKGRMAADGPLASHYQLCETDSAGYRQRTKLNVKDSDATLVLNTGTLDGGTLQTVRFAQTLKKPHLVLQLDELTASQAAQHVRAWLVSGRFYALNVAGPREEKRPGIYARAKILLAMSLPIRNHGSHEGRADAMDCSKMSGLGESGENKPCNHLALQVV